MMTRDWIIAFFERRQAAYDNLDAVALAADYRDLQLYRPADANRCAPGEARVTVPQRQAGTNM
jgi:hypothetical protein